MSSASSTAYILLCASALTGCSAYEAIGTYAKERNLYGERVCDSSIRADGGKANIGICPSTGESLRIDEGVQNAQEGQNQEGAL